MVDFNNWTLLTDIRFSKQSNLKKNIKFMYVRDEKLERKLEGIGKKTCVGQKSEKKL